MIIYQGILDVCAQSKAVYKNVSTSWYNVTLVDNWTKVGADDQMSGNVHQLLRHTPHDDGMASITIETYLNTDVDKLFKTRGFKFKEIEIKETFPHLKHHITYDISSSSGKKSKSYCEEWIFQKDKNVYIICYFLAKGQIQYTKYFDVVEKAISTFRIK